MENDANIDNKNGQQTAGDIYDMTINVIADLIENRDQVSTGHIERIQSYIKKLVEKLKSEGIYSEEIKNWDMNVILSSSQLHDIGKINISESILHKPGILTRNEFEQVKTHCIKGELIIDYIAVKTREDDFLLHAKKFAGSHHEKWNGAGYPRGLREEEIPLEGRLMAIADVYDALISERPYKIPFSHEEAVEIIRNDSGKYFDPKIVDVFLSISEAFRVEMEGNGEE